MSKEPSYPIRIRLPPASGPSLLDGMDAAAVVFQAARLYARKGENWEGDIAAIEENLTPVYERVAYDLRQGSVLVTDEDYEFVLTLLFEHTKAWANVPAWTVNEVRIGASQYHLIRDTIRMHLGVSIPDNRHVLANMRPS